MIWNTLMSPGRQPPEVAKAGTFRPGKSGCKIQCGCPQLWERGTIGVRGKRKEGGTKGCRKKKENSRVKSKRIFGRPYRKGKVLLVKGNNTNCNREGQNGREGLETPRGRGKKTKRKRKHKRTKRWTCENANRLVASPGPVGA